MHYVDVTTVANELCFLKLENGKTPKDCIVTFSPNASPAPPLLNLMRHNCDFMILDGSFLGGKGFHSETIYEKPEDNPAFNCYS
eukprot:gene28274-31381_t